MVEEDPEIQSILNEIAEKTQQASDSKVAKVTNKAEKVALVLSLIPSDTATKVLSILEKGIERSKDRQSSSLSSELDALNSRLEKAQKALKTHFGDLKSVDVRNATAKQAYGLSMELLNGYIATAQEKIMELAAEIKAEQDAIIEAAQPELDRLSTKIDLAIRNAKCPDITTAGSATSQTIQACKMSILTTNFPAHGACESISESSAVEDIEACIVGIS